MRELSKLQIVQGVCKLFNSKYAPMGCYWSDRPERGAFSLHIYADHNDPMPINVVEFTYGEVSVTSEFVERVFLAHVQARIAG